MKHSTGLTVFCCVLIFAAAGLAQSRVEKHPGLHPVRDANGKWGFIDSNGRFRIAPVYEGANEFSDGVAYVWRWEGNGRKNGTVDVGGKFTGLPETNEYQTAFHDGLAKVQTPQERKYGYIDKGGRVVIAPQFFNAGHFSEGLAWVSVLKERKWLYGFIDKSGKIVIEPQFVYQPGDFVDGLAKVIGQNNSGFIDKSGKFRILVDFERADSLFSEGLLAAVTASDPARGVYLDRHGKEILEIPFWRDRSAWQLSLYSLRRQQLAPFMEGLAAVLSFNRIGFIDKKGKVVIAPEFRETTGFSDGLAAVKIIGSAGEYVWGYIDKSGKFVIEPQFKEAKSFLGGLATVRSADGKEHLINRDGKVIWSK